MNAGAKLQPSAPGDGIPRGMCLRCGFQGPHPNALACISALRERIAQLEFSRNVQQAARQVHQRGANAR
jgi:hypothetical protein